MRRRTLIIYFFFIAGLTLSSRAADEEKDQATKDETMTSVSQVLTEGVAASPNDIDPVLLGQEAPSITVRDKNGKKYDLGKAYKKQPTVLIFYRGGWCPFCTRHLMELAPHVEDLHDLDFQVLALSMDRPEKLQEMEEHMGEQPYTLLSDSDAEAAIAFGLAFQVKPELVKTYKSQYNIDLEAASGKDHHVLPVPAAFLIDQEGKIVFKYVNPDYKTRIDPDVLMAAARSVRKNKDEE
ncbi:MAG: peroxiredoxin-like family protein [Candidatus Sumerlaeia bacterium]